MNTLFIFALATLINLSNPLDFSKEIVHCKTSIIKIEVTYNQIPLYGTLQDTINIRKLIFPKGSVLTISPLPGYPIDRIYITQDQACEVLYERPIRLRAKGRHTLTIRAEEDMRQPQIILSYLIVEHTF